MGREVTIFWLQHDLHQKILDLRGVENAVKKPFFQRLWDASSEEQRIQISELVLAGDREGVIKWMEGHPDIELGEMSLNRLRNIGRALHITNYCRLDRYSLEKEIEAASGPKQLDSESENTGTQDVASND